MFRRIAVLLTTTVLVGGCASKPAPAAGTPQPADSAAQAPRRAANVILQSELATIQEGDMYSAIQRLRPNFLMVRGTTTSSQGILVFLDGTRLGDVNTLRQLTVTDVKEVHYYSATEAMQRYGSAAGKGAILVTRK